MISEAMLDIQGECSVGHAAMPNFHDKLIRNYGCVILYCTAGEAVFSVNFSHHSIRQEDFAFVFWGVIPVFVKTSADFRLNWCMLSSELAYEICHPISSSFFSDVITNPVFQIRPEKGMFAEQWWNRLFDIYERNNCFQKHLLIRNHIQNMLLEAELSLMDRQQTNPTNRQQELFISFCRLLWEEHCQEHHNVKFYADKLCVSPYYLSLVTRNVAGLSPKKMIDNYVLLEIKTMLDTRDLTVNELAEIFHFNDPSYMCRYFKKQTGMSLSQYREAIRTKGIKTSDKK